MECIKHLFTFDFFKCSQLLIQNIKIIMIWVHFRTFHRKCFLKLAPCCYRLRYSQATITCELYSNIEQVTLFKKHCSHKSCLMQHMQGSQQTERVFQVNGSNEEN